MTEYNKQTFIRSYAQWANDITWSQTLDHAGVIPDIFGSEVHLYSSDLRDAILSRLAINFNVNNHSYTVPDDITKYYRSILPNTVIYAYHISDAMKAILDIDNNLSMAQDLVNEINTYLGATEKQTISSSLVQLFQYLSTIHSVCYERNFNLYNDTYQSVYASIDGQYDSLYNLFNVLFGADYSGITSITGYPRSMIQMCDVAFPLVLNINKSMFGKYEFNENVSISNMFGELRKLYVNHTNTIESLNSSLNSMTDMVRLLIIGGALIGSESAAIGKIYHNIRSAYAYMNDTNYTKNGYDTPVYLETDDGYFNGHYDGMYITGSDNSAIACTTTGHIIIDRFIGHRFDYDSISNNNNPIICVYADNDGTAPKIYIYQLSDAEYSVTEFDSLNDKILLDNITDTADRLIFKNADIIDYRLYSRFNIHSLLPSTDMVEYHDGLVNKSAIFRLKPTYNYGSSDTNVVNMGVAWDVGLRPYCYPGSLVDVFNNLHLVTKKELFPVNYPDTGDHHYHSDAGQVTVFETPYYREEGNIDPLGIYGGDLAGMYVERNNGGLITQHLITSSSALTPTTNSDITLTILPATTTTTGALNYVHYMGISMDDLGYWDNKYFLHKYDPAALVLPDGSIKVCFYGEIHPNGFGRYPYYVGLINARFLSEPKYISTDLTVRPLNLEVVDASKSIGDGTLITSTASRLTNEISSTDGLSDSINKLESFVDKLLMSTVPSGSFSQPAMEELSSQTLTNSTLNSTMTFKTDDLIIYYGIQRDTSPVPNLVVDQMMELLAGTYSGFQIDDLATIDDDIVLWYNGDTHDVDLSTAGQITLTSGITIPTGDPFALKWRNSAVDSYSKLNAYFGASGEFLGQVGYFPRLCHEDLIRELEHRLDHARSSKLFEIYNCLNSPIAVSGEFGISVGGSGDVIIPNSSGWVDPPIVVCSGLNYRNPGNNSFSAKGSTPMTFSYSISRDNDTGNWVINWNHIGEFTCLITVGYLAIRKYFISPNIFLD